MVKEELNWKEFRILIKYIKIDIKKLIYALLCFIISTITIFMQPLIIKMITDDGLINKNFTVIIECSSFLILIVLVNRLLEIFLTSLFEDIHNDLEYSIYSKAFNKLLKIKVEYFADKNSAEILDMITTDIGNIASILDRQNIMLISLLFQVISGIIGLLIISPTLTLIIISVIPIKYICVTILSKIRKSKMYGYIKELNEFSSWMAECINGVKEIKLANIVYIKERKFEEKKKELLKRKKDFAMIDSYNIFAEICLEWFVIIAVYILGGMLLINNSLSLGGLLAFTSYSNYVTSPISSLLNVKMIFAQIIPSIHRFFDFMNIQEETKGTYQIEGAGDITFDNVTFSYSSDQDLLKNVSFTIPKNAKVAIIGSNGSGKSTVLNLLLRLIETNKGNIKLNGKCINELLLEEYRKLFSVVNQNPYIFNESIKNNIDLEKNKSTDQLNKIYELSRVKQIIEKLPDGDNTIIGNNGEKLSGGERQKIAVARALIKDTPYIILDEATSGFDVESDSYLQNVITNVMKEKTIIIVTHKYENIENMDIVYKLIDNKAIRVK